MKSKRTRADSSCLWGGGAALKPAARARCAALVLVWDRPYSRALHQPEDSLLQRGAVSRHASCRSQRQAGCRVRSKRTRASAADRAASALGERLRLRALCCRAGEVRLALYASELCLVFSSPRPRWLKLQHHAACVQRHARARCTVQHQTASVRCGRGYVALRERLRLCALLPSGE